MRYRLTLCSVCLLVVSSAAYSQQISPNPNPVGNTITVDTRSSNNAKPFTNDGEIVVTNDGTLRNAGTPKNDGMLSAPNRGRLPPRLSSHVTGAPHSLGGAADIAACSTIDQALDRQRCATMSRMAIS